MRRPAGLVVAAAVACAMAAPATANGAWTHSGSGSHYAKAGSLPAGNTPTASVSNRSVTVSWTTSTLPGGSPIASYNVRRYDLSGNLQAIGSGCSGTVTALSCTETAVPAGTWKYTVAPVLGNWTGPEGSQSASVTVVSPSLTFSSSTTVTSLPTTLNGTIAGFVGGQTVTFRLDNASTGTVLSGTLSPTPVPSGGGSSVTVTIPAGTSNGAHTVYVVGSGGSDVASAGITVSVSYTATTSAWDLRDASGGGAESNQTATAAFSGDARTAATGNWPTVFNTSNYLQYDLNAPLPAGFAVSGAQFNFRFAATQSADTDCYWFEVRSASTNALLGTHGSSAVPEKCVTGTTLTTWTTSLPELSTTDLANDTRIKLYGRSTGSRPFTIDLATVSGTQQSTAFTLYAGSTTDAATGTPATTPWPLFGTGGSAYTSQASWATTFSTTRYLKLTFPSYIPTGATVSGATLKNSFAASASGHTVCYWFEVYSGATLLASHGSATTPLSPCNSSTSYQPDSISLPEINTPAKGNGAIVKMYYDVSGSNPRTTSHDLVQLLINYQ